jgi:hypothetical protein
MKKKVELNYTEARSLNDRAYDLLGEMILARETDALLAEIDAEKASGDTQETDAFFARRDADNVQKISRCFHRQKTRTFFYDTLPKVGRIAAVVIAALAVAGGVALAASHTVRVQVMKMLVNVEKEYTELSLVEDTDASFDVPAEWEGGYYPSYIPEGYAVDSVISVPDYSMVEYVNINSDKVGIDFSECGEGAESNIDTENATIESITVGGNDGFLATKENHVSIYWDNGQEYFILQTTDIAREEAVSIAESVRSVN